jgi:thiosulfate/3-mercaptopyruvate sulfurtransferase
MRIRTIAALAGLLAAVPVAAQRANPPLTPLLVSTAWLAEHLGDADVVVLQTSQATEAAEQIPGARVVPHAALMTMSAGHDLAGVSDLVAALEGAGVSNSSHVVIYGEPLAAGWLFFALDYLGHERTSMLDGGLAKWKAEGRSSRPITPASVKGRFQPRLRSQTKSSAEAIQKRGPSAVALLDARSEKEYVAGHIPGARLLTWDQVYADPTLQIFKSPADVAALFAAAGAPRGSNVITYCQIGLRSSLLYFAARYAGLSASNYVGSWSDWSAKGLPTAPAK